MKLIRGSDGVWRKPDGEEVNPPSRFHEIVESQQPPGTNLMAESERDYWSDQTGEQINSYDDLERHGITLDTNDHSHSTKKAPLNAKAIFKKSYSQIKEGKDLPEEELPEAGESIPDGEVPGAVSFKGLIDRTIQQIDSRRA